MSSVTLLYCTFPDHADAERVARVVTEEQLAACVNILAPCASIYRWQGAVETAVEVPALFKTAPDRAEALRDRIVALHAYDLPVIESWPVVVPDAVRAWIRSETD